MSQARSSVWIVACLCMLWSPLVLSSESAVKVLTAANFEQEVKSGTQTLVEFFAPWCGHCKALAPEYNKAATVLEGQNKGRLASVDCTTEQQLCSENGVKGFPTLKLFRGDGSAPIDYEGARKSDAIVKFMHKYGKPAVAELTTAVSVQEFTRSTEGVSVVAFVRTKAQLEAFNNFATPLRASYDFAVVFNQPDIEQQYHVTEPCVLLYRDFAPSEPAVYTSDFSAASFGEDLHKFIRIQSFPVVGTIGPENYAKYLERGFNFVWIFIDLNKDDQMNLIQTVVTPVATTFHDRLSFVYLDGVKWVEHAKSMGLSGGTPAIVIEDREKHKNYAFPENTMPTEESFRQYIQSYIDGTLAPTIKSEPIPEKNDDPVKVVVAHTFEQIVYDETKNVMVEFYAPWCGHCKQLAPKYDELAVRLQNEPNIVIAKIDATANDVPISIQGFPALYLFPAGKANKSKPVEFSGERTVDALAKFIQDHTQNVNSHDDL